MSADHSPPSCCRACGERHKVGQPHQCIACTGDYDCPAVMHIHGCFNDFGRCNEPLAHNLAAAQGQYKPERTQP